MAENNKYFYIVLLVFAVYVISGLGLMWWMSSQPDVLTNQAPVKEPPLLALHDQDVKGVDIGPDLGVLTANWETYQHNEYGYNLKHPNYCVAGDLTDDCEKEKTAKCLCNLNTDDPNRIVLEMENGNGEKLIPLRFEVIHYDTEFYNPPTGINLIVWLKQQSGDPAIPDVTNFSINDIPAVRISTPPSPFEYAKENIYLIKNNKLFNVSMLNVDSEENKKIYEQLLFTLRFD